MKRFQLFLFLITSISFAQNSVKVDLSNPNATLYTHIYFLMPDSYDIDKSAATIKDIPRNEAREKAKKIKEILDGNGLRIDFAKVPKNPDYVDTLSTALQNKGMNVNRYAPFPIRMPAIYVVKEGNKWYFSKETIESVDKLYEKTFPWEFSYFEKKFPEYFKKTAFGILIWKPLTILFFIVLSILLYFLVRPILYFVFRQIQRLFFRRSGEGSTKIIHELVKPVVFIIIIRLFKSLLPSLQLLDWNALLVTGIRIAETVFWIFVFMKLMKIALSFYYDYSSSTESKLDKQLAPLLGKLMYVIVVLIGFLHILTLFGVDPKTVLTGGAIGGIALAFAAQDTVKNLIGTVVIFLDKPFQLEDWVVIGGVEGTVEKVGFRSTRLRAADTTLYQIPNSKVTEMEINNKGLRVFRRYMTELGIRYDTPPDLIEAFMEGIKEIIRLHPETRSQNYNVEFVGFGDSALRIMVNVYFEHHDWGMEQASKSVLHMAIVKLAAELNVQFAFPSSTLMIEQFPGKESLATKYTLNEEEIKAKVATLMEEFKNKDHNFDPEVYKNPGIS